MILFLRDVSGHQPAWLIALSFASFITAANNPTGNKGQQYVSIFCNSGNSIF